MGCPQSLAGLSQSKVWLSLGCFPLPLLYHPLRELSLSNSPASTLGASLSLPEISQLLAVSDCVQVCNPQGPAFAQSSGAQV